MATHPLFELKTELIALCESTAEFIRQQIDTVTRHDIEEKEANSLVSYVDKEAEKMLVSRLSTLTPGYGFVTEEDTDNNTSFDNTWIIDPLDGTTNFLYKIPHFSISVALQSGDDIVLGIVYDIMQRKSYTAIKNFGAWENDKPISVSQITDPQEALVVTGFPYKKENLDKSLDLLKYCVQNYRGIRRLGSAALDLAFVASGKLNLYYENRLNVWDVAAGSLIVQEAGGVVSDYQGGKTYLNRGSILAGNKTLHASMMKQLQKLESKDA